jgi:hypothetical protein
MTSIIQDKKQLNQSVETAASITLDAKGFPTTLEGFKLNEYYSEVQ